MVRCLDVSQACRGLGEVGLAGDAPLDAGGEVDGGDVRTVHELLAR